jgi:hypothetical protein
VATNERDRAAVHQVYNEVGWLNPGQEENSDILMSAGHVRVADLEGRPECVC